MNAVTPKRLLLHVCCGPCATASLERLRAQGEVTLFYSNANIHPAAEYAKRLEQVRLLAAACACELVEDTYDHAAWRAWIRGLEAELEGGARCRRCFEYSLRRAARYAAEHGYSGLTTSLTISPHKRSADIFAVGRQVTDLFLDVDFKRADGFRRSLELSEQYGLYRQDYCGCEFSLAESEPRRQRRQRA